ncbi:5-methyltetrahydropteroyltriglutamate--homocysteine S-methyltransferase [Acinetobacter gerneri]|uniref:5-methyltetrahydropteroyltriglutamate--homocysteine S-methyltransferase n=1 Tax=Acinetobacter gerneri TaxID=202952 RepID=A0AAW8JNR5_9GAMM|nr:5-methyltetrahydropteroyltriglutamate--homocysteine S-methyltransferase [Acinetobacter gerneri]MDQ9011333.1 5-methyltetrahydropteroyltriglutamate--homocysteine S-methyltransferase [Acinetobacter gerneri]MDQ9015469.1 5-methyltetrahydropteroyltriglutamate--homocysteine S-methyltransferase [Acinetobacter gerneri]MDQ9026627.1 5-methyltetrahydropteroyltriglutamate--homocysteine S-methyltransferase [Acinetobacter gerneri]MDQ9053921.1 5-methyltetrahydropteroyltriglutamate--homocysteine S-methyltran
MTIQTHILGYPRIGAKRELKFACEAYWKNETSQTEFLEKAYAVEASNWQAQIDAGTSLLTVGDFVLYDSILTHAVRLGVIPTRFHEASKLNQVDQQFYLARGRAPNCTDVPALEMTKWFDTNYHYLVPELDSAQTFNADFSELYAQVDRAKTLKQPLKVVVPGLLTFLYLSRIVDQQQSTEVQDHHKKHDCECGHEHAELAADKATLQFVDALIPIYAKLFDELAARGVEYVQVDEPILVLDLAPEWQAAFERVYHLLQRRDALKLIITTYFETLGENLNLAVNLPVAGLHIDISREKAGEFFWKKVIDQLPSHKILSLGVINGRSVWASDLVKLDEIVQTAQKTLADRLWLSTGCSLLHVPVDLSSETVPINIDGKLAFARQKLDELVALASGNIYVNEKLSKAAEHSFDLVAQSRPEAFEIRFKAQQEKFNLPLIPTTTIGSFPQTTEIRAARAAWNKGQLSNADYETAMKKEITYAIEQQEALGLDVLVHGEAERTDMVEYFASLLDGFWLSKFGWVQSYGSRCVRPPIIVADISRPNAMTVKWIEYANSLSDKIVKGMLTGPVTILNWSFPPAHRTRREVSLQLAEAIRLEVSDLQTAGVEIIQIDEAAFREGLPLRKADRPEYWDWAVKSFKHCSSSAKLDTQIHTHMCYSDFKDCLAEITAMDADVITIETSRSGLQLLEVFHQQGYPNAIGPGVYDIHSPRTPSSENMRSVIDGALKTIPAERLWVNPDCGLKTRNWVETKAALTELVKMAKEIRKELEAA